MLIGANEYYELTKNYNSADLLKMVGALQLVPDNHGKNVRLEELARIAVVNINKNDTPVSLEELKRVLNKEYPLSELEDPPVNLFTENIMFIGGNYTVFPGIVESGTSILNNLLKAIFVFSNEKEYPESFIKETRDGALLMLNLFSRIARNSGLDRNYFEKIKKTELSFPSIERTDKLKNAVTFTKKTIADFCLSNEISIDVINNFISTSSDPGLLKEYPTKSLLCSKPIVEIGDEYILVQPTSSTECIIDFIWGKAQEKSCHELLLNSYHDLLWENMDMLFFQMQWQQINIKLPDLSNSIYCREKIFRFDINKLVYVALIEGGHGAPFEDDNQKTASGKVWASGEALEERQIEIMEFLTKKFSFNEGQFFSLFVISEVGFPQQYGLPIPVKERLNLWFRFSEIKYIVQSEISDPLLLWKFAKAYVEIYQECELVCLGGMLDLFVTYKINDYSLWPRNEKLPEELVIMPGSSRSYVHQLIQKRDEHLAVFLYKENKIYTPVYNYYPYAPFYKELENSEDSILLLEDFIIPIWFINGQRESLDESLISSQIEMLAFWLRKLKSHLNSLLSFKDEEFLVINVVLDSRFKAELRPHEVPYIALEDIIIPIEIKDQYVTLTIPLEMVNWYAQPNNEGERFLILNLIDAIVSQNNKLGKRNEIKTIIDIVIPKGPAKMFSVLGNANNIQMETRFLPPYRFLQQYELTDIKVNLTKTYGITTTHLDLSSIEGKKNLCAKIAETLYTKLRKKIEELDSEMLLLILIGYNESFVQQRAAYVLDIPVKVACLGAAETELLNLFQKEQERASASLAVRCLIELIVAYDSNKGTKRVSVDEIDQLMALMSELISWASLSDGLNLGLYNPDIKLLDNDRIDVDFTEVNSHLLPFGLARSEIDVGIYTKYFENLFDVSTYLNDKSNSKIKPSEIDEAFKNDLGIGLLRLHEFIIDLVEYTRGGNGSVACIDEDILYNELKKSKFNWTIDEIASALNVLTLLSGWDVGKPPTGFPKSDAYPWHYNRALSYIQRPIARLTQNNKNCYYWSYRHLFAAFDNIVSLLFSGVLPVPKGRKVEALIERIRTTKGTEFRNEVVQWFKKNSGLEIIPYEIPLEPEGILNAKENLGDIDILAIDHQGLTIYSIECKNTVDSRSVHEMKTEIDKYLGRKVGEGLIQKHIARNSWLKKNQEALNVFVLNPNSYSIKSLFITAEEIPLVYLKGDSLQLPFISFPRLKIEGVSALNTI